MTCHLCGTPTNTRPVCGPCATRLWGCLHTIGELYVLTHLFLAPGGRRDRERVRRSVPASAPPLRGDVLDAAAEIVRILTDWEAYTVNQTGLTRRPGRRRPGVAVQRAVDILTSHLDVALTPPDGPGYAAALLRAHSHTRHVLGLTTLVHRLTAPCPNCDHKALTRHNGDDLVRCGMCGNTWPEQQYAWLVRTLVDDADRHK